MEDSNGVTACVGRQCSFAASDDSLACSSGGGDCVEVDLLEAEPSGFHDRNLIEATRKIKEIVAGIPSDSRGRKLSFVHTNLGTLLAWVEHGAEVPADAVTVDDDDATVAKALRLKGVAAAGAGRA